MQLEDMYVEIRVKHRRRNHAMDSRKILDLRMGSLLRLELGWRKELPDAERKRIAQLAAEQMEQEEAHIKSREPYEKMENDAKLQMARMARQLPVWKLWGKDVNGFGEVSLAVIIAEAGDLWNYGTRQLRKRMCLMPGQDRVPLGLSKEERRAAWKERARNPRRRSMMWNIGDSMIKAQVRKVKDEAGKDTGDRIAIGAYGDIYLKRKAFEKARNPEMSDMHAHRRAQKVMEQRLLEDVRRAWHRTMPKPDDVGIGHNSCRNYPKDGYTPLYPA